MAYNSGYNPDALPAHAEPEQAAQLFASQQQQYQNPPPPRKYSNSPPNPVPYTKPSTQAYNNPPQAQYQKKPHPALPSQNLSHQQAPPQRLSPRNSYNSASYGHNSSPPPPQNYGFGPPPQSTQGRPPHPSRPPGTPAPPRGSSSVDVSLFPLFKAVDKSGTGQLTEKELGKALVNGDYTQFDPHTVKMMIRMFDVDKSGTINFDEFCGLWGFLAAWRALFDRFDEDKSGNISFDEYTNALVAFGYRLSPTFVQLLYTTYDKGREGKMSFDLFVQSCIILKRMTDVFKKYDEDRDGYITLSFEEFLTEVLRQR